MSTPRSSQILLPLLASLLLATPLAEARKTDREQPMEVRSDRQSGGLGEDDSVVLSGNVEITQGSLRVNAATATVERKAGEMSRIVLEGGPVRMQQESDRGEPIDASANRIVYSPGEEIMVLSGSAVVAQPRGNLRSETIRYNMTTGNVDSGGDGNRVQMTIQPKARPAAN